MPNRYLCTVLNEMRAALNQLNYVTLPINKRLLSSLVEEVQTLACRMESALEIRGEIEANETRRRELKTELQTLFKERTELETSIKELEAKKFEITGKEEDKPEVKKVSRYSIFDW